MRTALTPIAPRTAYGVAKARAHREMASAAVVVGLSAVLALALSATILASVDLLVTDVVMPGMDGATMVARLRSLRPDLPVLFVSGHTPGAAVLEQLARPGTAYLPKPYDRDGLADAIRGLLPPG